MQWVARALFVLVGASGLLSSAAWALESVEAKPSIFSQPVQLPQTANIDARFVYKHFHVDPANDNDLGGMSTHDIPAWTITILDGTDSWDGPAKLPPPRFILNSSAEIHDQIALFQVESGLEGGWIAVPRGWRVLSAAAGAQGSWGVTFVAPNGPSSGWLLVGGSGPGMTEVFSGAEGYFPGAYQLENQIIPNTLSRDAPLSPKPDSLVHPNRCSAFVTYTSGGLVVKGIKQFGDDGILRFSIALPHTEAALQAFLFTAFRRTHVVSNCPQNIKDW